MSDNNSRLAELMSVHSLSVQDVAYMLGMSVEGVSNWRRTRGTRGYRSMPDVAYKLLILQLAQQS